MSAKHNGGPAFPMQDQATIHSYAAAAVVGIEGTDARDAAYIKARGEAIGGMSLRDYFAAKALAAMLGNSDKEGANRGAQGLKVFPTYAYEWADAMLAERAKAEGGAL